MAFQGFLKEDTATTLRLGPFVDKTDGVTYEVGMAAAMNHADTGVRISKNGAALAARTTATEPVYDAFGYYLVNLDATDVGTSGRLKVIFGNAAVCLPCEADFEIIPGNLFDTLLVAQPAAAINKFFDVASSVLTCASVNQAGDAHVHADAIDTLTKASGPGDLAAILLDTGTDGVVVASASKTGFSLSATGADLILKTSTFAAALVAAINELSTYGLTALNTLLVTTGIKTASTAAPADMALNSTVGKEATLVTVAGYLDTKIAAILEDTGTTLPAAFVTLVSDIATAVWGAAARTLTAFGFSLGFATPANVTDARDHIEAAISTDLSGLATATNLTAVKGVVDAIKLKTDTLGGAGAVSWPFTVTETGSGVPIPGAEVVVSTDSGKANIIATGITDTFGIVTFLLDAGTYYFWTNHPGFNFTNPRQETVA